MAKNIQIEGLGLNKKEIKKIINSHMEANSDILMGIDDPEVKQMMGVLIDSISEAITRNNEQIIKDLNL